MGIPKKTLALLVIVLIVIAGTFFFFFYRMGRNDAKALTEFPAAYEKFDQAISGFSATVVASNREGSPASDDLELKTKAALIDLNIKASVRISSLTKNDPEIMSIMHEIGDLSGKEFETLEAYKKAVAGKSSDVDRLAKELVDLRNKRQTAYAHFWKLGD